MDIRSDTLRDRVNDLVANVTQISTGDTADFLFLPRDGSVPATAALDMDGNVINALATGVAGTDAVNLDQMDAAIAVLSSDVVLLDGTQVMTGDLNLGSNQINSMADGVAADDAVTVGQVPALALGAAGLQFVERVTITGAAVNLFDFATVLSGDVDEYYVIIGFWRPNAIVPDGRTGKISAPTRT